MLPHYGGKTERVQKKKMEKDRTRTKKQDYSVNMGVKRKEDHMEIDDAFTGTMKKTKNSETNPSIATAASTVQSCRTL